ncbi:cytochrome P450 [Xylariomycetidae sp. FL2044]|nr:cytochrome P450 [Xylariomycetidae sp. FL2044]
MLSSYSLVGFIVAYFPHFLVSYLLLLVSYRLLLHPLRDYPGPPVAKVFDGYGAYYSFHKCLHLATRRDHLRYGPVIRHGPNKLVFNSARALHDIYENERVQKAGVYLATRLGPHPNLFNIIDSQTYRLKRKLITNVLSERSMRTFEPIMMQQIDIFISHLRQCADSRTMVNISERLKFLGLDVVAHLAFGYPLNLQTSSENRHIVPSMKSGNHRLNTYMQYPLLSKLRLEYVVYLLMLLRKKSYLRLLGHMIDSRVRQPKNAKHDLYSIVASGLDQPEYSDGAISSEGKSLTIGEVWSEALFFLPAGGESIAIATSAFFFYLSQSPSSYQKLAEELRTTFTEDDDIRIGSRLASCRYLRACIDETLRITPPASGTLWREQCWDDKSDQPLIIDGHVIPKGTIFGVNLYSLHHNEEYFENPFEFRPERWLPSTGADEARRQAMLNTFAPFQVGSRACGGKQMAYLEISLIVAKTFWHVDFARAPGKAGQLGGGCESLGEASGRGRGDEFQLQDIFTADHDGPNLTIASRKT